MRIYSQLFKLVVIFLILNIVPSKLLTANLSQLNPSIYAQDTVSSVNKKPLTTKPPLGWNCYDSYRNQIDEKEALRNLEIFAKKLVPHGYEYFVIDLGWYSENACIPGSLWPWGNHPFDFSLDVNGYPVGSRTYFPKGIKPIADRAHELGVKFGLPLDVWNDPQSLGVQSTG